jgi:hypothetical protein
VTTPTEKRLPRFVVTLTPVFIDDGIPLIARRYRQVTLDWHALERFDHGVVQPRYRIQKGNSWLRITDGATDRKNCR